MQIADQQLAAKRAWHLHLLQVGLMLALLVFVPVYHHRVFGSLANTDRIGVIWGVGALSLLVFIADLTLSQWRQLRYLCALTHPVTLLEFRRAKAQETWRNTSRGLILLIANYAVIGWTLRGSKFPISALLIGSMVPLSVQAGRAWRELRRTAA